MLMKQMEPRTEHRYKKYLIRKRIAKLTYKKKYGSEDTSESLSLDENTDNDNLKANQSTFHRLSHQIQKNTLKNLKKNEIFGFEERKHRVLNHKSSSCERLKYFAVDTTSQFKENVVEVFDQHIQNFFKYYSGFREYFSQKNKEKTSLDVALHRCQSTEKLNTKKAISLNEKLANINKYAFQEFVIYNRKNNNQIQDYTYSAMWKNICRGRIIINSMDDFERSRKSSMTFNKQKTDLFKSQDSKAKNRFFRKNSVAANHKRHFLLPTKSNHKRLTSCNQEAAEDTIDFLVQNRQENIDYKKRSIYNGSQVKQALGAMLRSHNQERTKISQKYQRKASNKSIKISHFRATDSPSFALQRGFTKNSFGSKYYIDDGSAKKGHHYSKSFFGQGKKAGKKGHIKNQISLIKMEELPSLKRSPSVNNSNNTNVLMRQVLMRENPYKKKITRQQTDSSYLFYSPKSVFSKKISIASSKHKHTNKNK